MDIVSRLMAYKDSIGLTNSQFADKAGIARPTLSQFFNGRNKRLSDELISKLHTAFPDLNVAWLLFGEGEMVGAKNFEISESLKTQIDATETSQSEEKEPISVEKSPEIFVQDFPQSTQKAPETVNIDKTAHEIASKVVTSVFGGGIPHPAAEKKIKSIMVFYSDNSYETFIPQD